MTVQRTGSSRHAEWRCGRARWLAPVADLPRSAKTMKEEQPVSRLRTTPWQIIETLLWGFALSMVVPPVLSIAGQKQSAVPALLIGGTAFVCHIAIKVMRREESVVFGVLKTGIYAALVLAVHMRVFV